MVFATQIRSKGASEVRNVAVSYADKLESGELLTGTPTITDSTGDLTLTNKVVSTGSLTINGVSVAAGAAVTFTVSGGSAGTTYDIRIQSTTDATNAQTFDDYVQLEVL